MYCFLLAFSLSTNLICIAQDEFSGTLIAKSSKEKKQKDNDDSSSQQAADDDNKPAGKDKKKDSKNNSKKRASADDKNDDKNDATADEDKSEKKNAAASGKKTESKKSDAAVKNEAAEGKADAAKTEIDAAESAEKPVSFSGNASWYGIPFHGKKTASGEIFDMYKCSAAHLHLPLPTKCLVEDPRSGNAVIVKVNDRGPYVKTRVMDLSREAARELGTLPRGVAYIDVTVLESKHKSKNKG